MNRTRYRLPAIVLVCAVTSIALLKLAAIWIWLALLIGVASSVAEVLRHFGDLRRIVRRFGLWASNGHRHGRVVRSAALARIWVHAAPAKARR
jgi:hypothetical protein